MEQKQSISSSILSLLDESVMHAANKTALVLGKENITFGRLVEKANQLANYLTSKESLIDVPICFCLNQSIEKVITMIGIWKAGGAYVSLDPLYPTSRLQDMMEEVQTPILVTTSEFVDKFTFFKGRIIVLDEEMDKIQEESSIAPKVDLSNALAYFAYTSGSTGRPKAVMAEHAGVYNFVKHFSDVLDPLEDDIALNISSSHFDGLVLDLWAPLSRGTTVYLYPDNRVVGDTLLDFIRVNNISVLPYLPISILATLPIDEPIGKLRKIFTGGEAPSAAIVDAWKNKVELINMYGPTETTVVVATFKFRNSHPIGTIGKPLPNVQFHVLNKDMQPVRYNEVGELYISGVQVTRGYFNSPELTEEKFINYISPEGISYRTYKTGDLFTRLEDETIAFVKRADSQVKIRGFRIEPFGIEEDIRKSQLVHNCCIIVKGERPDEKYLVCYYKELPEQETSGKTLRQYLIERLPEYMVPSKFYKVDEFPLTENGKINRKVLSTYELPEEVLEESSNFVAPSTPIQTILAEVWCEVLKIEQAGIYDHFFHYGGNSILAYKFTSALKRKHQIKLSTADLFAHTTIAALETIILEKGLHLKKEGNAFEATQETFKVLSQQQKDLWFLDKLNGSIAYNVSATYPLAPNVNIATLEQAFRALIEQHSILRTVIKEDHTHPYQVALDSQKWTLQSIKNKDAVKPLVTVPFNLEKDFMLRAYVIYEEGMPNSLLINMHHIAVDGWSMPILVNELNALYQALLNNPTVPVFAPIAQYADYAAWQTQQDYSQHLGFWKDYLFEVPVLQLAYDYKKQQVSIDKAKIHTFHVSAALMQGLEQLSKTNSATLYMTLLSAFSLLMQYYSAQNDICIGSPAANRTTAEVENMIGYFVNMLPIRFNIEGNPNFDEYLRTVRDMLIEVFQHQELPLESIISNVIKDRYAGHNPLFQTVFIVQDDLQAQSSTTPIDGSQLEFVYTETPKFDLQFEVFPSKTGLKINIEYATALFKDETIAQMANAYLQILESIVRIPSRKIGSINILSSDINLHNNAPENATPAQGIIEMFEAQVAENPEKVALVFSGDRMSYGELNKKANHIANLLLERGIGKGSFVALYQEQSIERIICLLAILKAGAAYLPLDVNFPIERLKTLVEDTAPVVLLTTKALQPAISALELPIWTIETFLTNVPTIVNPIQDYTKTHSAEDLIYVIHTSGTTGTPKGVLVEHQAVNNFIEQYNKLLKIGKEDHTLQFSPYNFDGSVIDIWIPLTKGATVHLYPNSKLLGVQLAEFLVLNKITVIPFFSPSVLSTLPQEEDYSRLHTIGTGGEACPAQVSQFWKNKVRLVNVYGPTETTVAVNNFIYDNEHPANTLGLPIDNMRFYVLDNFLRTVPQGVVGELYISGIQLSRGYLNQPELTAEKFIANPYVKEGIYSRLYKTGDQVRVLPNGMVEYIGRADHQVKVRGYRIELAEIENVIIKIDGISHVVVDAHKTRENIITLRAFVVGNVKVSDIKNIISQQLPPYMVPNEFLLIDKIPVTPNGKVDKKALNAFAETYVREADTSTAIQLPTNHYEEIITDIWSDVLQCKITNLEEDFFQLGGHSLLLTKLYNKIFAQFPNKISLSELYTNSTIKKLAAVIEEREKNPSINHYPLGQDPLSAEIWADANVDAEMFKFNLDKKGDFENPKAIFLTGVTGFVGSNMLVEFLKTTEADIYVLIRAKSQEHAKQRLIAALEDQYLPTEGCHTDRVKILVGDLGSPFLGLTEAQYLELTDIIDVVHHAGSAVNFIQPYSYMRAANVDALHTLIKFVTTTKLKRLSLLSTVGVFSWEHYFAKPEAYMEDDSIDGAFKYLSRDMGYIQSKWVMEKIAQKAISQGVPITIFRLGYVFCHHNTGATARYQWWGLMVKTCVDLGYYPLLINQKEELVMVDFIARAVAHISKNPASIGEAFHVSCRTEDNISVIDFFEKLKTDFNLDLKPLPYKDWMALWENDEASPLYPLLNLFKFVAYDNKSILQIHQNTPDFDISKLERFLADSDINNFSVTTETLEAYSKYLGLF